MFLAACVIRHQHPPVDFTWNFQFVSSHARYQVSRPFTPYEREGSYVRQ